MHNLTSTDTNEKKKDILKLTSIFHFSSLFSLTLKQRKQDIN